MARLLRKLSCTNRGQQDMGKGRRIPKMKTKEPTEQYEVWTIPTFSHIHLDGRKYFYYDGQDRHDNKVTLSSDERGVTQGTVRLIKGKLFYARWVGDKNPFQKQNVSWHQV
jgi:hypothetical protein